MATRLILRMTLTFKVKSQIKKSPRSPVLEYGIDKNIMQIHLIMECICELQLKHLTSVNKHSHTDTL